MLMRALKWRVERLLTRSAANYDEFSVLALSNNVEFLTFGFSPDNDHIRMRAKGPLFKCIYDEPRVDLSKGARIEKWNDTLSASSYAIQRQLYFQDQRNRFLKPLEMSVNAVGTR